MLNEDTPVTTTNNNGQGLVSPELPIKKNNIFSRTMALLKRQKAVGLNSSSKSTNSNK